MRYSIVVNVKGNTKIVQNLIYGQAHRMITLYNKMGMDVTIIRTK